MIRGMAGELAAQLQDGQPCAVCGSTTHPEPARQSENHPDHDAIEEAEAVQARAERQLADAREAYERVRAELAALNDQCGTISSTQAEADDEEAQTQLTYIRERAARVEFGNGRGCRFEAGSTFADIRQLRLGLEATTAA